MRAPAQLTPQQQEAVDREAPRLLLVASAGSGKTEVLTQRVIRHLQGSVGETFRILAVTFTVRAAQELQARLRSTVSTEAWRVDADTIHGFALDWLMRFGQRVNVFPDTVVYADETDRLALLADLVRSLGEPDGADLRGALRAIDDERLEWATGNDRSPVGPGVGSVPFSDLFDGYTAAIEAANGIDFPGMLAKFMEASRADPAFLQNFWSTYRHVLVDEGQDLSAAQAAVVESLAASPLVDLFVVADDRQSINGFAGGSFENVRTLVGETVFGSPLHLPHNFRCATEVLAAAERVASHLRTRPSGALAAENAPTGSARLVSASSPMEEAETVAVWAEELLSNGLDTATLADGEDPTVRLEDIAVIGRARWLLDPVVESLTSRGIDVSIQTDSQSFLQTPTGRVLSEGITLVGSVDNVPACRRLGDELAGLGVAVRVDHSNVSAILRDSGLTDLQAVGEALDGMATSNFDDRLVSLQDHAEGQAWSSDLDTLRTQWANYKIATPVNRLDLLGFVRHLARAQQTRPSDPGVRVLTIHKVKGLEFKAVCLLGAYNGALPDYRATTPQAIDEERRAFYVAMTRASRHLLLTCPRRTTDRYGRSHEQSPSIFAVEAGFA